MKFERHRSTSFQVSVPNGFNHVLLYVLPSEVDDTTGSIYIGTIGTLTWEAR